MILLNFKITSKGAYVEGVIFREITSTAFLRNTCEVLLLRMKNELNINFVSILV